MGRAFEEGALTLDGEDKEEEEEDGTSFVLRVKKTNRVWGEGGKKGSFSSFLRYVARAFKKVYNHGWDKVINRKGGEEVVRLLSLLEKEKEERKNHARKKKKSPPLCFSLSSTTLVIPFIWSPLVFGSGFSSSSLTYCVRNRKRRSVSLLHLFAAGRIAWGKKKKEMTNGIPLLLLLLLQPRGRATQDTDAISAPAFLPPSTRVFESHLNS